MKTTCALLVFFVGCHVHADEKPQGRYWQLHELLQCYGAQINRLRAAGYAEPFGDDASFDETLRGTESPRVELQYAAPLWVDEGNIPLLIVIHENYAPLRWQATRVTIDGVKANVPRFAITRVKDVEDDPISPHPYVIFNVSTGAATLHRSAQSIACDFAELGRRGLTFAEGIALLIHYPDTVRCEKDKFGQCVFLRARFGDSCRYDEESEEVIVFAVREDAATGFARGYFTFVPLRDMTPNHTRFLFPSCDSAAPSREK